VPTQSTLCVGCNRRQITGWTVTEFVNPKSRSIRIHPIDWSETSRPDGFIHLPEQVRDGTAWQFGLTANRYGRVHGLLIGGVFHIVGSTAITKSIRCTDKPDPLQAF
jgi:hypothetical protein